MGEYVKKSWWIVQIYKEYILWCKMGKYQFTKRQGVPQAPTVDVGSTNIRELCSLMDLELPKSLA
ncbi:hypothetical protein Lumi_076 [Xylophilus phage Lumi]|nr:hypothetical protein Lumi_076 [Xylophilus phage Lumi]